MTITKSEFKYIFYAIGFSLIWFLLLMPFLLDKGIENSNVYMQFLIFNIGIFIFLQIFLKSAAMGGSLLSFSNISCAIGLIFLIIAVDIILPPFLVTSSGELLNSVVLRSAGSDYVVGYFAANIGLSGTWVFIFTYIFAPAVLLFLSAKLLPNFVKEL